MKGGFFTRAATGLFLLSILAAPLGAHAQLTHNFIGLSPSSVDAKDLLRDRVVEKTVNLQRDLADVPLTLQATFKGPDARFITGPEFIEFDAGQFSTTYTFQIAPDVAATGAYSATIDFLPVNAADAPTGTGFGIRRGVTLKVGFTVTDKEIVDYSVLHSEMRPTEVGLPFFFTYTLDNTGNVEWRPDRIVFSFKDIFTDAPVGEITLDGEDLDYGVPGNVSAIQTEVEHELPPNNYSVEVKFYENDEIVHLDTGTLVVFEAGTLAQEAVIDGVTTNKLVYRPGENIKVTGRLQNTGHLVVTGIMVTEVYSGTDELVDILTSDPREVAPGEVGEVDQFVKLNDAGEYRVEAHFEYASSKATETASTVIQVEGISLISGLNILPFVLLGLAALLLILLVIFIYLRKKRRRAPKVAMPPQSAQPLAPPTPPARRGGPMSPPGNEQDAGAAHATRPAPKPAPANPPAPPNPTPAPPAKPKPAPAEPPKAPSPPPAPTPPPKKKKDVYMPPKDDAKPKDDKGEDDDMWTISL